MIRPTLEELLNRVAEGLEADVLPELEAGYARRQLETALRVIRRAAFACERMPAYLDADNADIEQTLTALLPALDGLARADSGGAVAAVIGRVRSQLEQRTATGGACPAPAEQRALNGGLQQLLSDLREALPATGANGSGERDEVLTALRSLFRRMLARQLELATPPAATAG